MLANICIALLREEVPSISMGTPQVLTSSDQPIEQEMSFDEKWDESDELDDFLEQSLDELDI